MLRDYTATEAAGIMRAAAIDFSGALLRLAGQLDLPEGCFEHLARQAWDGLDDMARTLERRPLETAADPEPVIWLGVAAEGQA